jgi:hypothetical protein
MFFVISSTARAESFLAYFLGGIDMCIFFKILNRKSAIQ